MAVGVGFEPTVPAKVHLISSQARSSTPAPHRLTTITISEIIPREKPALKENRLFSKCKIGLFLFTHDAIHGRAAYGTLALHGIPSAFHVHFRGIVHSTLLFAFDAICFDVCHILIVYLLRKGGTNQLWKHFFIVR